MILSSDLLAYMTEWTYGGPKGDCWEWTGCLNKKVNGYPQKSIQGASRCIHRLMYQMMHPNEDLTGLVIRHKCDNTKCMNPAHLISGTQKENLEDARKRNRLAVGERASRAKLTNEEAQDIYDTLHNPDNTLTQTELAKIYGVSSVAISNIYRGQRYGLSLQK